MIQKYDILLALIGILLLLTFVVSNSAFFIVSILAIALTGYALFGTGLGR